MVAHAMGGSNREEALLRVVVVSAAGRSVADACGVERNSRPPAISFPPPMDSPVEQSRRLQERYASLTEDELLAIAEDSYDLTDMARQTLQAEIAHRGLHMPLKDAPPPTEPVEPEPGDPEPEEVSQTLLPATDAEATAEVADGEVPRCPQCHSADIVFQGLDEQPKEDSVANSKFNWSCDSCGHQWKDDGVEEEA